MASLYYALEDGTGDVLLLEDGTGNYLLEPIEADYTRRVQINVIPTKATKKTVTITVRARLN